MLDDKIVLELRPVLLAQHHLLERIRREMDRLHATLAVQSDVRSQIGEAEALLTEIEASQDFFEEEDLADFDADDIQTIYNHRCSLVRNSLKRLEYTNWDSFIRDCQTYALTHGIDPLQPYEVFLTDADLVRLRVKSYEAQYHWDKWDYIFVGASGVLAALTDFLLVKIHSSMGNVSVYTGQKGSPLTAWLKSYTQDESCWFAQWSKSLEAKCRVPYDVLRSS